MPDHPPPTPSSLLETAVRAFTLRTARLDEAGEDDPKPSGHRGLWRPRWREVIVWDTETVTTPDQRLLILCWRLYVIEEGHPPRRMEEGLAYPDDLEARDPDGYRTLIEYVAANPQADIEPGLSRMGGRATLRCEPLSWWLHRRLFLRGYTHRERCDIVGLNLMFDLGRIASYWAPAEDEFYGGWSLGIWGSFDADDKWQDTARHPRLRAKAIDPRRTRFEWGSIGPDPTFWKGRGRFVDLRALTFALTDKGHTLESGCAAFDVPYTKRDTELGRITPDLLAYAREDVEATSHLYFACLDELARHEGVDLQPHRLYSPATIGARYLDAMGYQRPLEKFTNLSHDELGWTHLPKRLRQARRRQVTAAPNPDALPTEVLGWAMSAFYGGRAEARIVRTPVPVTLVDFTSMYPSVNALLDTRALLTAERIRTMDVTSSVREILARSDIAEWCLTPDAWLAMGVTLVEVEPRGAVLPVRGRYDPATGDLGIGVNPYRFDGGVWYALPDLIAARILTSDWNDEDPPLVVKRAVRLVGEGVQPDLRAVRLRGGRELDPRRDDPFLAMIEERHRVRATDPRQELFLKVTANSTSYGVLARFDRRERATPTSVRVYGPDDEPFEKPVPAPEDPGPFCFPPVAASITAAARLMLALLEHQVNAAGGSYAFCDTDSLAIVATNGTRRIPTGAGDSIKTLSHKTVQEILDRFARLNPYDPDVIPGSPWSVKFDSDREELWCYAISAKRYALYHLPDGKPELVGVRDQPDEDTSLTDTEESDADSGDYVDWSEHGLGLYLDPTTPDPDRSPRDSKGRRFWIRAAWEWVLQDAHGHKPRLPRWASRYALTRFTVSGPRTGDWFAGYNENQLRETWIRPGSFGLIAHPATGFHGTVLPAAPYEPDPEQWPTIAWYDRGTSKRISVTTLTSPRGDDLERLADSAVPIQTVSEVIRRYRLRPEHKSIAAIGGPASRDTVGLLQRRRVESTPTLQDLTGKEGNKLLERASGEITDPADYQADYGSRGDRWVLTVEAVRRLGAGQVAERAGLHRRSVERVVRSDHPSTPHRRHRAEIAQAAARLAAGTLEDAEQPMPTSTFAILTEYVRLTDAGGLPQLCRCGCGRPLPPGHRIWFEDACRVRARRQSDRATDGR